MAKVSGWKSAVSVIVACGIIGGLTARAVVVGSYHGAQDQVIEQTTKAVNDLKTEGCLPARNNEKTLIRMEGKIDAAATEQKASETRILKAIENGSP